MAAEGARTDGTTNVQGRSIDCDNMRTTVVKLPTDCVKFTEPTLTRVSPVVTKMAHTDGTRVMQYQSDDQNSMKTTNMQMPMDYLEIPEPALPRGFLKLAEEARNVNVDSGRPCYTEEVQPQGTGLTRPVFVTVMVDSPPVLKKGALRAIGISTEMIPNMKSAGRREPVDRSGLVGPQNRTEQSVLLGLDVDHVGTAPSGPVGPDFMMDRIQPVAEGPVGQNRTRRPVGTEEMLSASDLDRPTADGPVGRFVTHGPVGPDRKLSKCDPDRSVADSPVGRFLKFGPMGHLFTPGPVGTHARVSDDKRRERGDDSPVGSTGILDPVSQTGSPIQSDFMKTGTINGPASSGDTPPSSVSGVHSLGEQWEDMSTNSIDIESEQNERPSYGSTMRRGVSDTSVPPDTEDGDDVDYPWIDRLLERESDDNSSIDIQQYDCKVQFNKRTIGE